MEDYSEDWCFICKDGGRLMLCDHNGCSKVYHPRCVGKNKSFLKSKKSWTCNKHLCCECFNGSVAISFSCLCCTYALCGPCYISTTNVASELSMIKGKAKEGLCNKCLELVKLAEANSEYGPDGKRLDFEDRDTFECRFKECWEIIKENEGLTFDDVYSPNRDNDDDDEHIEVQKSILGKRKAEAEEFISSDNDRSGTTVVSHYSLGRREEDRAGCNFGRRGRAQTGILKVSLMNSSFRYSISASKTLRSLPLRASAFGLKKATASHTSCFFLIYQTLRAAVLPSTVA